MEKETLVLAEKARENCRLFVLRHLLTYLIEDEQKHDRLLAQLESFQAGNLSLCVRAGRTYGAF